MRPFVLILSALLGAACARADLAPTLDGRHWVPAGPPAAGRLLLEGDSLDAPKEEVSCERLGFELSAEARVVERLGERVVWHWRGSASACGEVRDAAGLSEICLAVDTGDGVTRLTYGIRESAGTAYYREKRLEEWARRFRLQPFNLPPPPAMAEPPFLVYRTSRGLFRFHVESSSSEPLAQEQLRTEKFDYTFYSVAEVDGERVNILRRVPRFNKPLINHAK